ncbi:immunity 49 family protein [Streptomyces griseosporeus]|uniref:immunity 49 family protein n=1 Tax=Streptomyces griseosporeus TaxID=1910 RepID=UPI0036FF9342
MTRDQVNGSDPELPMLSLAQGDLLRRLVAPYLQEGRQYSLHNLAHLCRQVPQERWPEVVGEHFARLREASQGGEGAEELLRGVYARLLAEESISPQLAGAMRYARRVADGLVLAYALDGDTSVRILTDQDVERVGAEELGQAARANLMRVAVRHEEIPVEGGAVLHSLYGDSPFVASQALFLAQAARQATGEPLPDGGALVVVPTRHNLVFHPVGDGSVVDAVNSLAAYALGAYQDGAGALSPRLYWWHHGRLTSLTVIDDATRSFSVQPPPELLRRMRSLVRLAPAGRILTRDTAAAPDLAALGRRLREGLAGLAEDPSGLAGVFAGAVTLAHARCADDPRAAHVDTWDPWALAVQLGTLLFAGGQPQKCVLGEDLAVEVSGEGAVPPADVRSWLDAVYVAIVCREWERVERLCGVPVERLREDDSVDPYVLHWAETLRAYFTRQPMDDIVQKLLATMEASMPDALTHGPDDFVNRIDYQPVALFHRILAGDHDAFAKALTGALSEHRAYWGDAPAPRARVALGPLAMAVLARGYDFPVADELPYLPKYLLDGGRIEVIPRP